MPTPQELAHAAEQYDEEQWFEFLEELDAVSRRRQHNKPAAPEPAGTGRDEMARWIARTHLAADSGIQKVLYLPVGAPADEIRLLEVNDRLALPEPEKGEITPIEFGLEGEDAPFRLFVADITSDQLEAIRTGDLALPEGWHLAEPITTDRRP